MKYPESALAVDETIVFDVHHHISALLKPVLLVGIFLAAWLILVIELDFFRESWVLLAGLVLLVALLAFLASRLLVWLQATLVLTDRRLIYRHGVFTKRTREIPLSRINDVATIQLFLGRIFSSGDIVLTLDSSSGAEKSAFYRFPHPEKLKLQVQQQAHAFKAGIEGRRASSLASEIAHAVKREQPTYELPPLPPERPPLYSEIVDQIERLDALRERGTLTDTEFEEAKQSLMERFKKETES
jgi:uncharacterized membrane protein YdbT with pleckstrin-like domain